VPRQRLLFLVNSLPAAGGAEQFVLNHVRHTDRARFDVAVCQIGRPSVLRSAFEAMDVPVYDLREKKRPDPMSVARLAALLARRRVDILQSHCPYAVVVGRLVGRLLRVPAVVSTEQGMHYQYRPKERHPLDLTIRLADANVFISRACFEAAAARHPWLREGSPHIIPNGIDTLALARRADESRGEVRRELGLSDGDLAYVTVARLVEQKGHRSLFEGFARVAREIPAARLFVVGVGPLDAELRGRAQAVGLGERISFLGERTDVPRLLGGFDVFVHAATIEALGVAVLEAMCAGLPTIGAHTDALPELIDHERTGWLVPQRDPDALAERMLGVARDRDGARAVAARGREKMQAHYDIRACARAYEALYEELLARRARHPITLGAAAV
jgi:glycosyltransferase involved in cell wall biosynthesis